MEAEKQLSDKKVYQEVSKSEKILSKLAEMSNKMFSNLKMRVYITEKKATNFGKLYFLTKIHKRLHIVLGRLVISNCGTRTENWSEFLDYDLKPLMQKGWSHIKDSGDFIKKTRNLGSIPENAILVTEDVVGLYLAYHMKRD